MDEQDTDVIGYNDHDPHGGGRRRVRLGAVAGVAFVAVAAGASAGYAATHHGSSPAASTLSARSAASPSPSSSPSAPTPAAPTPAAPSPKPIGPGGHRFGAGFDFGVGPGIGFGLGGPAGPADSVAHGQVVIAKPGGGYQTEDVQSGKVTAVSSSSLTVKSSDGYTATYAVTSSTIVDAKSAGIGSVKTGDSVFVTATVSGSTATATNVTDQTAIRATFKLPG